MVDDLEDVAVKLGSEVEAQVGNDLVDVRVVNVDSDVSEQPKDEQLRPFVLEHARDPHVDGHSLSEEVGNEHFLLGRQSRAASLFLYPPVDRKNTMSTYFRRRHEKLEFDSYNILFHRRTSRTIR